MNQRMMLSAQWQRSASDVVNLVSVVSHTHTINVMDVGVFTTNATFSRIHARQNVSANILAMLQ
jgi:hypothetical protein